MKRCYVGARLEEANILGMEIMLQRHQEGSSGERMVTTAATPPTNVEADGIALPEQ